ncbi:recombinase family protein [Acetonema longum]|uniref:Recombinase family protein n=1 Tax=Acetonema longum DSM 6540 TaxID=1009370 RepID=F7NI70_9FIRM|nr:recombinase family protein [Acetonema longum]EGO64302.1 recombinase family protein [Acetonema longum DSM 6540]
MIYTKNRYSDTLIHQLLTIGGEYPMILENRRYDICYVANYLRKSRAESMEDLEKHRMILTELCIKNGFKYVEYIEVGTSDSIDMRPKISKLLKEVEDGIYDAVCVVEYDRLGRGDLGEQDRIKKAFQKSETLIITPDKIYDLNNDIDDTYADLKGFFARQEYKMITKRLRQGKVVGARRGDWTNGIPAFPYVYQRYRDKYNEKGLVVNDERLPIYREMIEKALSGISTQKIAESLNQRGIFTRRGNYWSAITIYRLLVDETHLGQIISNKTRGSGHKHKRPNAKNYEAIPKSEWTIVENCHEAVKTKEEHDRIVAVLSSRKKIPTRSRKQSHVFTGLVKCAKCGHILTLHLVDGNAYVRPCWYTDPLGNKCKNSGILSDALEEIVLKEISKYQSEIINSSEPVDSQQSDRIKVEISELENLLQKYKKALETVNDAYELGDYNREEWQTRKRKWQKLIGQTENELYEMGKIYQSDRSVTDEERKQNLIIFLKNIRTMTDHVQRNDLYKTVIESIVYLREGNTIDVKIDFK